MVSLTVDEKKKRKKKGTSVVGKERRNQEDDGPCHDHGYGIALSELSPSTAVVCGGLIVEPFSLLFSIFSIFFSISLFSLLYSSLTRACCSSLVSRVSPS